MTSEKIPTPAGKTTWSPSAVELVRNEIKRRSPGQHHLHKNSPFTAKGIEAKIAEANKKLPAQLGRKEQIWRCLNGMWGCGNVLDEFDLDRWNALTKSVTAASERGRSPAAQSPARPGPAASQTRPGGV